MIRSFFVLFSLSIFLFSLYQLSDYWEYEESPQQIEQLFKNQVSQAQIEEVLYTSLQMGKLDDAKRTLALAQRFSYNLDVNTWQQRIDEQDTWGHRIGKSVQGFTEGFVSGKGQDGYAIAGAMTSDFTVVGDVRDLREQYLLHEDGKPVNELIVTLSGIGIGLTAMTIGTAGVSAPAKAGTSLIKFSSKSGRLNKSFSQELLQKTHKAFDWQAFQRLAKSDHSFHGIKQAAQQTYNPRAAKQLSQIANNANNIRRSTSTADAVYLLKYVENSQDLRRMEKMTSHYGTHTKGIVMFLGKSALRGMKVLKKTVAFILSLIGSIVSGFMSLLSIIPMGKKSS